MTNASKSTSKRLWTWTSVFLQKRNKGELITDLGTRCNQVPENVCPLCHVFHFSRYKPGRRSQQYQVQAFSYLKSSTTISFGICHPAHKENDIICLGVVPASCNQQMFRAAANKSGHLFCLQDAQPKSGLFAPRLVTKHPDSAQI